MRCCSGASGTIGLWFMDDTRKLIGSLATLGKGVALVLGLPILAIYGFRLIRLFVHLVIENPIQAPERLRPILLVLGAFLFASAYPVLYDSYLFGFRAFESPYFWTLRTIDSARSSGFLVLLLVVWLLIVRSFIRQARHEPCTGAVAPPAAVLLRSGRWLFGTFALVFR